MILSVGSAARTLTAFGKIVPCVIGRSGTIDAAAKREGDGATPLGRWPLRAVLLRPDRGLSPPPGLPWRWLRRADGWSDDPGDHAYNRPVVHPLQYSAEHLWRDDGIYDVIIVLGYNDSPPISGAGSAIFMHLTRPDRRPTEGCVGIGRDAMLDLLPRLARGAILEIR